MCIRDRCWIGGWYPPTIVREPDMMDQFETLDGVKVLLCHKPEHYIKYLRSRTMDLVVAGHAHGGQIRVAGRGVFSPGQGLFPRYTYGVNLSFGWKGLNLSAFFQGVGKVDGYLSSYYVQPCQQGGTFRKEHLDRWNETNPNGKYPRLTMTDANNWKQSSFWMRSAAYCRLKNIQLSYTLPRTWLKKLRMKSAMVFVNAQNLFTITDFYQGFDPEVAYSGSGDGVELGAVAYNYPQVKVVTMGVELKF